VSVPSTAKLEKLARDTMVYFRIERVEECQRPKVVQALALDYDISEDRVCRIYAKTKVKLEDELGFKAVRRNRRG